MLRRDPKYNQIKKVYFLSRCDRVNPFQWRDEKWIFTIIINPEKGKWSIF